MLWLSPINQLRICVFHPFFSRNRFSTDVQCKFTCLVKRRKSFRAGIVGHRVFNSIIFVSTMFKLSTEATISMNALLPTNKREFNECHAMISNVCRQTQSVNKINYKSLKNDREKSICFFRLHCTIEE